MRESDIYRFIDIALYMVRWYYSGMARSPRPEYMIAWRLKHRDRLRAINTKWYAENGRDYYQKIKDRKLATNKKWRQSDKGRLYLSKSRTVDPEKIRARSHLRQKIRSGKIIRLPCERCGAKAHAHHDDYSKPLDVRWLCVKHHLEYHRLNRK